jgi:hypothetical protein
VTEYHIFFLLKFFFFGLQLRNFRKFYRFYIRSHKIGKVHHVGGLSYIFSGNNSSKSIKSKKEKENKAYLLSHCKSSWFVCLCGDMERRECQRSFENKAAI